MAEKIPNRKKLDLRWSDIDPNFHLRHSVYYDFGAQLRTEVLGSVGLTLTLFAKEKVGPVLFKEECVFKREIHFGQEIYIDFQIIGLSKDLERFAFRHRFTTAEGDICAILTLTGAWMDTEKRKLTLPPKVIENALNGMTMSDDFQWIATSKSPA